MKIDNPKTRATTICPICRGHKDYGLVVCWPCYHSHGLKYGNQDCEAIIAKCERELEKRAIN